MVVLRNRHAWLLAPYGIAAALLLLGSTRSGYQDMAALMAQQTRAAERWREHVIASPFGTIHAATFSLPRPVGTLMPAPEPVRLARFDPDPSGANVNRGGKGDLLVPRIQIEIMAEILREDALAAEGPPDDFEDLKSAVNFTPFPAYDISMSLELDPKLPAITPEVVPSDMTAELGAAGLLDPDGVADATRVYFDAAPMNVALTTIAPWDATEMPVVMVPASPVTTADAGTEMVTADKPAVTGGPAESVVQKGVADDASPAQRLRLAGAARTKAEKCLANAVYFEARSEPVRGQVAVAQVVLNRAFSGHYPNDVCGVVYQNAHRHLSCQFTFACDGIPDVVTEPVHWQRAMRIAKATLDGKLWLPDVAKATHYHASYVYPYWVRSMRKHQKIGLHTFYRPRAWGVGEDAPSWGTPAPAGSELVSQLQ